MKNKRNRLLAMLLVGTLAFGSMGTQVSTAAELDAGDVDIESEYVEPEDAEQLYDAENEDENNGENDDEDGDENDEYGDEYFDEDDDPVVDSDEGVWIQENCFYEIDNEEGIITIYECIGEEEDVWIPASVRLDGEDYQVVLTGGVFQWNSSVCSVTFENGVKLTGDMSDLFAGCSKLVGVYFETIDTSDVTNMSYMFAHCVELENINISAFDTSGVENMDGMFQSCESLETLNLSSFDLSSVTEAESMLNGCDKLREIQTPKAVNADVEIPLPVTMYELLSEDTTGEQGYDSLESAPGEVTLVANSLDISNGTLEIEEADFVYDGEAKEPDVVLYMDEEPLTPETDYRISYLNNVDAGTATVKVRGIGKYGGVIKEPFEIAPLDFSSEAIVSEIPDQLYTGEPIEPELIVSFRGNELNEWSDYRLEYQDNVYIGEATVVISGEGNYTGEISKQFQIVSELEDEDDWLRDFRFQIIKDESGSSIVLQRYLNDEETSVEIPATATYREEEYAVLLQGSVFGYKANLRSVVFQEGVKIMDASGLFMGCEDLEFLDLSAIDFSEITNGYGMFDGCYSLSEIQTPKVVNKELQIDLPSAMVLYADEAYGEVEYTNLMDAPENATIVASKTSLSSGVMTIGESEVYEAVYTGEEQEPKISVSVDGKILEEGTDYWVSYGWNNVNVGEVVVKAHGMGDYAGTLQGAFWITEADITDAEVSDIEDQIYTGFEIEPEPYVSFGGEPLSYREDFELSYKNNVDVGEAMVVIKGRRNFTGEIEKTFNIKDAEKTGTWLDDYTYEVEDERIILTRYNDEDETDLTVHATVMYYEKEYPVALRGDVFSGKENLRNIVFEDGVTILDGSSMFYECIGLGKLDLGEVKSQTARNMNDMFAWCNGLSSLDVSKLNTGNVRRMNGMFAGCASLSSLDVSTFNTRSVKDMEEMFSGCSNLQQLNLGKISTGKVTNMDRMFMGCEELAALDLSSFDFSGVKTAEELFSNCGKLTEIRTPLIANEKLSVALPSPMCQKNDDGTYGDEEYADLMQAPSEAVIATTKPSIAEGTLRILEDVYQYDGTAKEPEVSLELDGKKLEKGTDYEVSYMDNMNAGEATVRAVGVNKYRGTIAEVFSIEPLRIENAEISEIPTQEYKGEEIRPRPRVSLNGKVLVLDVDYELMYEDNVHVGIARVIVSGYGNYDGKKSASFKIEGEEELTGTWLDDFEYEVDNEAKRITLNRYTNSTGASVSIPATTEYGGSMYSIALSGNVFSDRVNLKEISFGEGVLWIGDMGALFNGCSGLSLVNLDGVDAKGATSLGAMFGGCTSLRSLDLSGLDIRNAETLGGMFSNCTNLMDLNLGEMDTKSVVDMSWMFSNCPKLDSLDMSSFDTEKVRYMMSMFEGDYGLKSLDLSGFDVENVDSTEGMFSGCFQLKSLNLSGFAASSAMNMSRMFEECSALESLDVSGFDTSRVVDMSAMFYGCMSLTSLDASGFETTKVAKADRMFAECGSLTSLKIPAFSAEKSRSFVEMFKNCGKLKELDVSKLNFGDATYAAGMFMGCSELVSLDLSHLEFAKVVDVMDELLEGCQAIEEIRTPRSVNEKFAAPLPSSMLQKYNDGTYGDVEYDDLMWAPTGITIATTKPTIADGVLTLSQYMYAYDGEEKTPTLTVMLGNVELKWGEDYEVSYVENINAGEAAVIATGINNYRGSLKKTFTIKPINLSAAKVEGVPETVNYTGDAITLALTVSVDGKALKLERDYVLSYEDNVTPGNAKVVITGNGNYGGSKTETFRIVGEDGLTNTWLDDFDYEVNDKQIVLTKYRGVGTEIDVPGVANYKENSYPVVLRGAVFDGKTALKTIIFEDGVSASGNMSYLFDGCGALESLDFRYIDFSAVESADHFFTSCESLVEIVAPKATNESLNIELPRLMVAVDKEGNSISGKVKDLMMAPASAKLVPMSTDIEEADIRVESEKVEYDGREKTPKLAVILSGVKLDEGTDYEAEFSDNVNIGIATVLVKGVGDFEGEAVIHFEITEAAKPPISNVTNPSPSKVAVRSVTLSKKASVAKGKSITLKATIKPSNATNQKVTWNSSDKKVATVTQKGVVRGVKKGKAIITVKTADENKTAKCTVTVTDSKVKTVAVKSVKLNKKSANVKKGKTVALKATISPSNATNKNVTWKSSNKKIATVTSKGVVKGVKKGKATITVTTKDGKKKATCKVTVK